MLPKEYADLGRDRLRRRIAQRKAELGERLCILGHHYQSDEVIQFADFTGDSLKLSRQAAEQTRAGYIVFCGVHFMAESADVLSADDQVICLPNLRAGCPMADLADTDDVAAALDDLAGLTDARIVPVAYVNSAAAVKALTARAGGACCTSSNARNVFRWALTPRADGGAGGEKVLAIPDQHLGRNTAVAMGYGLDDCVVYDPHLPSGGLRREEVSRATFILWKGHCYVHQLFRAEHVERVRARHEGIKVIVHPECRHEVVRLSDASGSTEQIIRAVAGVDGGQWAIGTESNLVNRLARRHGEQFIRSLSDAPALCVQMGRIDLPHLLWVLDQLARGEAVNRVAVPRETAADARTALKRMIDIKASPDAAPRPPAG
jgi:quinolinate synthase